MSKYSYDDLTYELLHKILTYDSKTGELYWKPRPRDMFKTDGSWKSWNTKNANKKAGSPANIRPNSEVGYWLMHITILGKNRKAHRVAWFMHYGEWPKDQIDHINGNPLDNRIENLRDVSNQENCRNTPMRYNNTTGVTGVIFHKGKFYARIHSGKKKLHLGTYATLEEAAAARREAEIKYGYHENHGREKANAESE